jgi:hypothetical protein
VRVVCVAVALLESELPLELIERFGLGRRVHVRGGQREVRFYYRDREPLLPVWFEGRQQIVRWGGRRRGGALPPTGWTWRATVEAGGWAPFAAEAADIPAMFGLDGGVWFSIRQGVRGLVVRDADGEPVAYLLIEPATRYYQVMTRSDRMPVLIGEVI